MFRSGIIYHGSSEVAGEGKVPGTERAEVRVVHLEQPGATEILGQVPDLHQVDLVEEERHVREVENINVALLIDGRDPRLVDRHAHNRKRVAEQKLIDAGRDVVIKHTAVVADVDEPGFEKPEQFYRIFEIRELLRRAVGNVVKANEKVRAFLGRRLVRLFVQVKHFVARKVHRDAVVLRLEGLGNVRLPALGRKSFHDRHRFHAVDVLEHS